MAVDALAPPSPPSWLQLRRRTQINRIKLSRELMLRLSLALNQQDDQGTVPAGCPISRSPEPVKQVRETRTQTQREKQIERQIETKPVAVQQLAWKRAAKIRLDGSSSSACKATHLASQSDNQRRRQSDNWLAAISLPSNCDEELEGAQEVSIVCSTCSSELSEEIRLNCVGERAQVCSTKLSGRGRGQSRGFGWRQVNEVSSGALRATFSDLREARRRKRCFQLTKRSRITNELTLPVGLVNAAKTTSTTTDLNSTTNSNSISISNPNANSNSNASNSTAKPEQASNLALVQAKARLKRAQWRRQRRFRSRAHARLPDHLGRFYSSNFRFRFRFGSNLSLKQFRRPLRQQQTSDGAGQAQEASGLARREGEGEEEMEKDQERRRRRRTGKGEEEEETLRATSQQVNLFSQINYGQPKRNGRAKSKTVIMNSTNALVLHNYSPKLKRDSNALGRRAPRPPAKRTCDSPAHSGSRRRHFPPQPQMSPLSAMTTCLLWLTAFVCLISATQTSDELTSAVLATMSTPAPHLDLASGARSSNLTGSRLDEFPSGANLGGDYQQQQQQTTTASEQELGQSNLVLDRLLQFCRIFVMGAIIVGDICGNSLVILSVCRHSKLRVTTNWFVVSLACADILVAVFAMTFNASVIISGRWLFSPWVCDFWNSCDVLASTASILHLCCISIDRYIAIMRPLDYPMKITTRRVVYALAAVWIASALLSCIPIFTGIYTTEEHISWQHDNLDQCEFVVNRPYAIVSSSISFWIPCCIMVFTYYRIYREATRQEKLIYKAQNIMPAPMLANHHRPTNNSNQASSKQSANRAKQRRSKSVAIGALQSATGKPNSASIQSNESRIKQLAIQQQRIQQLDEIATTQLNSASKGVAELTALNGDHQTAPNERASSLQQLAGKDAEQIAAKADNEQASKQEQLTTSNELIVCQKSSTGQIGPETKSQMKEKEKEKEKLKLKLKVNSKRKPPHAQVAFERDDDDDDEEDDEGDELEPSSGQSTPTKRSISKMKREHKAAKTLGIIMGVFILCWLPFFSWYTPQHICGHACDGMLPRSAVTILFWIGYFNSTLNPIIYAYFNHEFRDAFKKTLQWIFCCCEDLKCLRVSRPNDNQHYNCTYRSTQEIGLVSNS